jgi:hypothetical protein
MQKVGRLSSLAGPWGQVRAHYRGSSNFEWQREF